MRLKRTRGMPGPLNQAPLQLRSIYHKKREVTFPFVVFIRFEYPAFTNSQGQS